MKVFIEQPGEEKKKNIFDKKTGKLEKTISFHLTYPYPYGYILDTLSDDGDNLDCFVITDKKLETGSIVECEPIGMLEQFEDGRADHNILAILKGDSKQVDDEAKEKLLYCPPLGAKPSPLGDPFKMI